MNILTDESIRGAAELFADFGPVRTFPGRRLDAAMLADAEALIVRSVTRVDESLLAGSRVRFVGSAGAGADHVDLSYLRDRGIHFASAAGCNARTVAEYVLAALMLLTQRHGSDADPRRPAGTELGRYETLGVVGVGRIGSIVADWAAAFGLRVLRCDPPRQVAHGDSLRRDAGEAGFVELDRVADEADMVTLHVPLTDGGPFATRGMVDARWLARLRPGTALFNTSRGAVIDEAALLDAVRRGRAGPVVLDVWRNEPAVDPALAGAAFIATPHVAGYSVEAHTRAARMVRDQLAAFLNHPVRPDSAEEPRSSVDEPRASARAAVRNPVLPPFAGGDSDSHNSPAFAPAPCDSTDPVAEAVLRATGILEANRAFRDAVAKGCIADEFDALRRRCAERREFTAYAIDAGRLSENQHRLAERLGFSIERP